jgi:hypothetical protein
MTVPAAKLNSKIVLWAGEYLLTVAWDGCVYVWTAQRWRGPFQTLGEAESIAAGLS